MLPAPYELRLQALRRQMAATGLAALLVSRPENRRYLSGYSAGDDQLDESSGCLLITTRRQCLLTDFRYQYQAQKEAVGYEMVIYLGHPAREIGRLIRRFRIKKLAIEEDLLTVKTWRLIKEAAQEIEMVPSPGLVEQLRLIKDKEEIRKIVKALDITEKALSRTLDFIAPGRTEREIAFFIDNAMVQAGADGSAFGTIAASGPNAAMPHAEPTKRRIQAGETIVLDFGAKVQGYGADLSRTVIVGSPQPWITKVYSIVRRAQLTAIQGLQPGLMTDQADALARQVITDAGYGPQFGHSLGHGVGLASHEAPTLSRRQSVSLREGMVVTVEPGIYLKGKGGVRLEDMVLITNNGCKVLNQDRTFYDW